MSDGTFEVAGAGGDDEGQEAGSQVTDDGELETGSAPQQGQSDEQDGTETNRDRSADAKPEASDSKSGDGPLEAVEQGGPTQAGGRTHDEAGMKQDGGA